MELENLKKDRFLRKDPNQEDSTKGASYAAVNPVPKKGNDSMRKIGRTNGSEEDHGAENILTGTVITSCFIQTSALPSRIELEGNDLTLFDDTYSQNGKIVGDASRIVFTHGSGSRKNTINSGFILQKRALTGDTYSNVLELFSPNNAPSSNYIFIGRRGTGDERNIRSIDFNVNHRTNIGTAEGFTNGVFRVRVSRDGKDDDLRDGLYVIDRASVNDTGNDGSICWLVGGGPNGQVRLSYTPTRATNPSNATIEIQVGSAGIRMFGLPGNSSGLPSNTLWNDGGTVKIT